MGNVINPKSVGVPQKIAIRVTMRWLTISGMPVLFLAGLAGDFAALERTAAAVGALADLVAPFFFLGSKGRSDRFAIVFNPEFLNVQ